MAVRVVLDTNRLTDLFQGDARLAKTLGRCEEVLIPLFVLAEMKAGFYSRTRAARNEALLRSFLTRSTVRILMPGRETCDHYARLFVQLKHAGTPIPINDLWIASLTIEHDATLITRDRHFAKIPQLLSQRDAEPD